MSSATADLQAHETLSPEKQPLLDTAGEEEPTSPSWTDEPTASWSNMAIDMSARVLGGAVGAYGTWWFLGKKPHNDTFWIDSAVIPAIMLMLFRYAWDFFWRWRRRHASGS